MKFYIKNVSGRIHFVDQDIRPGQTVEYSEEDFAKYAKPFSSAMQSTKHGLTRGYKIGSDSEYSPGDPELEIYAEIDGERGRMTVADVANYAKEATEKKLAEAKAKAEAEAAAKAAEDKDRQEFEAWRAKRAKKAEANEAAEK